MKLAFNGLKNASRHGRHQGLGCVAIPFSVLRFESSLRISSQRHSGPAGAGAPRVERW